ncbi:MAG: type I polyketide synthase, partial [Myxococcota bacterium]
ELFINFSKARMMSPTGRCHAFDARADGFVRAEGCGVIVLKALAAARRDGDRILATIRGTAINHDGRTSGLTVPSGPSQQAVIRAALRRAQLSPGDIDYIEAHGTGTSLGDPIEVGALRAVFARGRDRDRPLVLGGVKSNLGHLEAAAGMAGLIKVILAVGHGELVPQADFGERNPLIDWDWPVTVQQRRQDWPNSGKPHRAGVSSFGFGGTNAHVIVEEAPPQPGLSATRPARAHLLCLSARTASALATLRLDYAATLASAPDRVSDICFTSNTGRTALPVRSAMLGTNADELATQLSDTRSVSEVQERALVGFLFAGQGSQRPGMGRALYDGAGALATASFRQAIERCTTGLAEHGVDLPALLFAADPSVLMATENSQPALFSLEYAQACMWRSWGVEPDLLLGHSLGELVAACIAGIFSLEDGLLMVAARGRLMAQYGGAGEMHAVYARRDEVAEMVARHPGVCIAGFNGPYNQTISGRTRDLAPALAELHGAGLTTKKLAVNRGFHSPLMGDAAQAFAEVVSRVHFRPPEIPIVDNITGQRGQDMATADYWYRQICAPVRFAEGVDSLRTAGITAMLELGPGATLTRLVGQCVDDPDVVSVATLNRDNAEDSVLAAVGSLFERGVALDMSAIFAGSGGRIVTVPGYPFERQRHWYCEPELTNLQWAYQQQWTPVFLSPRHTTTSSESTHSRSARLRAGLDGCHSPPDALAELEALSLAYMIRGLSSLGWPTCADGEVLAARHRLSSAHRKLLQRMLDAAAQCNQAPDSAQSADDD